MLRCGTAGPGLTEACLQALCIHQYNTVLAFPLSQHASNLSEDRSHVVACNLLHGP